ncbi:hypothetical protein CEXT_349151 [Caerostris extrusa]|uniref:Uncharacterized protein n=1 Tax=Caerostris extrusa TaxID=172846 RepID=A0AAV4S8W0_CAEEX|nr:hypothetical protein CEXT_349151 [Caerostris extrusa]
MSFISSFHLLVLGYYLVLRNRQDESLLNLKRPFILHSWTLSSERDFRDIHVTWRNAPVESLSVGCQPLTLTIVLIRSVDLYTNN